MSRLPQLSSLFGKSGASAKYRAHGVQDGYPIEQGVPGSPPPVMGPGEKLVGVVHTRVRNFDLSDAQQLKEYTEIRDRIANRAFFQFDRRVWTDPTTGNVKVYMEWGEPEYKRPRQSAMSVNTVSMLPV